MARRSTPKESNPMAKYVRMTKTVNYPIPGSLNEMEFRSGHVARPTEAQLAYIDERGSPYVEISKEEFDAGDAAFNAWREANRREPNPQPFVLPKFKGGDAEWLVKNDAPVIE